MSEEEYLTIPRHIRDDLEVRHRTPKGEDDWETDWDSLITEACLRRDKGEYRTIPYEA